MTQLDKPTLRQVYNRLRSSHPEAALEIADLIMRETPVEWAEKRAEEFSGKRVDFVKEIRANHDLTLKEANKVAKEVLGPNESNEETG